MNNVPISERIENSTREVPVLTSEQKQGLLMVDSQPINNGRASAISELVGVLAGLKPSALMRNDWINTEDIEAVGLNYNVLGEHHFAVSRDGEISDNLSEVFETARYDDGMLSEDGHRQLGKLLGFPETSTEYFLKRTPTVFTPDELPMVKSRKLQGTASDFFHQFILSPDHYEEEINTYILPLVAAVKSLAPNTYLYVEEQTHRDNEVMRKQDVTRKKIGSYIRYLITPSRTPELPEQPEVKILYVD
jgi:hypothetical protein